MQLFSSMAVPGGGKVLSKTQSSRQRPTSSLKGKSVRAEAGRSAKRRTCLLPNKTANVFLQGKKSPPVNSLFSFCRCETGWHLYRASLEHLR